jgi:hypothetical protein
VGTTSHRVDWFARCETLPTNRLKAREKSSDIRRIVSFTISERQGTQSYKSIFSEEEKFLRLASLEVATRVNAEHSAFYRFKAAVQTPL